MSIHCLICEQDVDSSVWPKEKSYLCDRCGFLKFTEECAEDFDNSGFSAFEKASIGITLRNEFENNNRIKTKIELGIDDLKKISSQYKRLKPLEKMEQALINLDKIIAYAGQSIYIPFYQDYYYFHCVEERELIFLFDLLTQEKLIRGTNKDSMGADVSITSLGYKILSELETPNRDSRKCFVAMWFTDEMNDNIFKKAIKPAIEYVEEGEKYPTYEAVKIDNVEHANDINDEIISSIRRSRFIVCDLTGYRGGVYFEAGFAYGLGLTVIYTCRKDWIKDEFLRDKEGKEIKSLYDNDGNEVNIKKEGVHFDLAHRNRIEWEPNKLPEFRKELEYRIKSVIY